MPDHAPPERFRLGMMPLHKVAMGLVLTLVDPVIGGYDAVPDVLGWLLVVLGLRELRARLTVATPLGVAVTAGLVSLVGIRPAFSEALPENAGWLLSLPQIVFSFLLCNELARVTGAKLSVRFRWLSRVFVLVAVAPVLVYGGGLDALLVPAAVLAVVTNVYLVYLLFPASTEVHGPRRRVTPRARPEGGDPR